MLQDEVRQGITFVAEEARLRPEDIDRVSRAIASEALSDAAGRQALVLDRTSGSLVFYDLFKSVTATAGVLGSAVAAFTAPDTFPAVLSAVAALGSLQGLRKPLSRACAQVVSLLLERQDRKMTREEMRSAFEVVYTGPPDQLQTELERALAGLESIGSIRIEIDTVRLVERIVIRL